jgi:hypothetical protein
MLAFLYEFMIVQNARAHEITFVFIFMCLVGRQNKQFIEPRCIKLTFFVRTFVEYFLSLAQFCIYFPAASASNLQGFFCILPFCIQVHYTVHTCPVTRYCDKFLF